MGEHLTPSANATAPARADNTRMTGHGVFRLADLLVAMGDRAIKDAGWQGPVTDGVRAIMAALDDQPMARREIVEAAGLSKSRGYALIKAFESSGLLQRLSCEQDSESGGQDSKVLRPGLESRKVLRAGQPCHFAPSNNFMSRLEN